MKLLDLLNEYITLEEFPHIPYKNIDIELGELMIARWGVFYCEVIDLIKGESLRIQRSFMEICYGFYNSRSEEIVRIKDTPKSPLWEIILASVRIVSKKSIDLSKIKNTNEIRKWLKSNHNIDIEPIIYSKNGEIIEL